VELDPESPGSRHIRSDEPSPENHDFWHTADEFLYGPGVLGFAEKTKPHGESPRPSTIDVDIEVWCSGRDAASAPARLKRMLTVTMSEQSVDQWTVSQCSISKEGVIGFFDPPRVWLWCMGRYFVFGLGVPIVVICFACNAGCDKLIDWLGLSQFVMGLFVLSLWLVTFASLFFGAYYAYWLTGTVVGVASSIPAALILAALVSR
jgi:hypothetical protein